MCAGEICDVLHSKILNHSLLLCSPIIAHALVVFRIHNTSVMVNRKYIGKIPNKVHASRSKLGGNDSDRMIVIV